MKTPNTGVETAQNQSKVGAIKGLSAKIVTALAAIGIATSVEKVEGAITITTPSKVSGAGLEQNTTTGGISNIFSSRTLSNSTIAETASEMTISVSAADAGLNGGTLLISGYMRMITGVSNPTVGQGYANTTADINQQIRGGAANQSLTTIITFDGPGFLNDSTRDFNGPNEGFDVSQPFSFSINVPVGGIDYRLQNVIQAFNADATARLSGDVNGGMPINYQFSTIPEPTTGFLVGSAATLALLKRRRKKPEENK